MFGNVNKYLLLVLATFSVDSGVGELFSAIEELEKLGIAEKFIIDELSAFAGQLNDSYVTRFEYFTETFSIGLAFDFLVSFKHGSTNTICYKMISQATSLTL